MAVIVRNHVQLLVDANFSLFRTKMLRGSIQILSDPSVTSAQLGRARHLKKKSYPQVPGSITAKKRDLKFIWIWVNPLSKVPNYYFQ